MDFIKKIWLAWKHIGQFIGDIFGRFILTIFYFTILLPFGFGMRIFGDPLDTKRKISAQWSNRNSQEAGLNDARRLA